MDKQNYLKRLESLREKIKKEDFYTKNYIIVTAKNPHDIIAKINEKEEKGYSLGGNKIEIENDFYVCKLDKIITPSNLAIEIKKDFLEILEDLLFEMGEIYPNLFAIMIDKIVKKDFQSSIPESFIKEFGTFISDTIEIMIKLIVTGIVHDSKIADSENYGVVTPTLKRLLTDDLMKRYLPMLLQFFTTSTGGTMDPVMSKMFNDLNNSFNKSNMFTPPNRGCEGGFAGAGTFNTKDFEDLIKQTEKRCRKNNNQTDSNKYNKKIDDIAKSLGEIFGKVVKKSEEAGDSFNKMANEFVEKFKESVDKEIKNKDCCGEGKCNCKNKTANSKKETSSKKDSKEKPLFSIDKMDIVIPAAKKKSSKKDGDQQKDK